MSKSKKMNKYSKTKIIKVLKNGKIWPIIRKTTNYKIVAKFIGVKKIIHTFIVLTKELSAELIQRPRPTLALGKSENGIFVEVERSYIILMSWNMTAR